LPVFGSGELRLVLLRLIADESRHGYELIKAIEELTGGNYAPSPGVVYPTLSLLTDEGMVSEVPDGARKSYAVTEAGAAELAERSAEADGLIERLKALGEEGERHRAPPIARATGNLFAALRGRAQSGAFDKDTIHAIAEILDEAAQKIERL
jgi:DNA-binding PadR family transcriptional regulator